MVNNIDRFNLSVCFYPCNDSLLISLPPPHIHVFGCVCVHVECVCVCECTHAEARDELYHSQVYSLETKSIPETLVKLMASKQSIALSLSPIVLKIQAQAAIANLRILWTQTQVFVLAQKCS